MPTCPECDADVEVDDVDIEIGDEVSCPECGQTLVVSSTDPLELDFAPGEDEEEEDDDDDDDLDDDDLDEDESDEDDEEDEDWEE